MTVACARQLDAFLVKWHSPKGFLTVAAAVTAAAAEAPARSPDSEACWIAAAAWGVQYLPQLSQPNDDRLCKDHNRLQLLNIATVNTCASLAREC